MGALAAATHAALVPAVADMERAAELGSGDMEDEDANEMQMVSARGRHSNLTAVRRPANLRSEFNGWR